jgi:hypothetical protein
MANDNGPNDMSNVGVDSPNALLTIGWREYVAFPDWGIRHIKVKVDTGARTSALGVVDYELREEAGSGTIAVMRLALGRKSCTKLKEVHAAVLRMVAVRNTSGIYEQRPLIETTIRLGPVLKRVPLTLASRAGMCFRMILGRKALEGSFLVDVSKQYLLRKWSPKVMSDE